MVLAGMKEVSTSGPKDAAVPPSTEPAPSPAPRVERKDDVVATNRGSTILFATVGDEEFTACSGA